MYVHESAKLVYLANPRTGSTSVAKALMGVGFKMEGTHHSGFRRHRPPRRGWTTFAAVRNHWDAAVSWVFGLHMGQYRDLVISVESIEFALNNEWISKDKMWGVHNPDIVMRYENLEDDLNGVLSTAGLEAVKLPKHNVSTVRNGRHYDEFHTVKTGIYIYKRFKEEIERFGYEF